MGFGRDLGSGLGQGLSRMGAALSPVEERRQANKMKLDANRNALMQKVLLEGLANGSVDAMEGVNALKKLGLNDLVIQDVLSGMDKSLIGAPASEDTKYLVPLTKLQRSRDKLLAMDQTNPNVKTKLAEVNKQITKLNTVVGRTEQDVLSTKEIQKLSDVGGKVQRFADLAGGFKDDFGGYGAGFVGDAVNFFKRKFGDESGQALWWQDYKSVQNVIRNKLFGSALTKTEKAEWEKTIINPGDHPDIIRGNLARQSDIARRAANKLANSMLAKGKDMKQVRTALGGAAQFLDVGQTQTPITAPVNPMRKSVDQLTDDEILQGL